GLAPTSADFCVPGTCFVELKDEPLGKHPSQAAVCTGLCFVALTEAQQDVVAADDESSFTFDVEGLGDEALDHSPSVSAWGCVSPFPVCGISDEALDDSPSVSAAVCMYVPITCYVDGLSDEELDGSIPRYAFFCNISCAFPPLPR
ncbi:MAG: hypothetical protein V7788_17115, partial [Alphaproteobacteria bacterium]